MSRCSRIALLVCAAALALPSAAAAASGAITVVSGPANGSVVASSTVRFAFVVRSRRAAQTRCALDAAAPAACVHEVTYRRLTDGPHTVTISLAGGSAQVSRSFTVHAPPTVAVTSGPAPGASVRSASVSFGYAVTGARRVTCTIDARPATACPATPVGYTLGPGAHVFRILATGRYGHDAATRRFIVAIPPPVRFTAGPADGATITHAAVSYTFAAPGATAVRCRADGRSVACRANRAVTLRGLAAGAHVFSVSATNRFGTRTAARHVTVVAPPRLVDLRVGGRRPLLGRSGYAIAVDAGTVAVTWTAAGSPATATCTLGDVSGRCRSGIALEIGTPGIHVFTLVLRNAAGSVSRRVAIHVG